MGSRKNFAHDFVYNTFAGYPGTIREKLLAIRALIFDVAAATPGVGLLEETLKWGEPAYLTSQTKSGSTVRLGWKEAMPKHYAIFFNCNTLLVDTFKEIYGELFHYSGNRCILFEEDEQVPVKELSECIAMALTYHLDKKLK